MYPRYSSKPSTSHYKLLFWKKNLFYFKLKSLSVLKIFTFLHFYILSFWLCRKTDNKAKINFKIYDVTDWTINNYYTHFLQCVKKERQSDHDILSISRYFPWKIIYKMWKNQSWVYLWTNSLKCNTVCFIVCPNRGLPKYIKTEVSITCFTSYKAFLKNENKSGTSLPASVSGWFLKKNIFQVILY